MTRTKLQSKIKTTTIINFLATLIISLLLVACSSEKGIQQGEAEDLVMIKSEITETVKFYTYKLGRTEMQVMAVRASDGSIRTAFNTCQVCYDSGRGYYIQQGNQLICQNCGNRFLTDQLEIIRGGCNPVPITQEDKIEDEETITLHGAFLEANSVWFKNWKR